MAAFVYPSIKNPVVTAILSLLVWCALQLGSNHRQETAYAVCLQQQRKHNTLRMRTVADILEHKTVPTNIISPNALVIEALHLMKRENLSYVIAMEGADLKGIFSERNYARHVALEGKSSATCTIKEAMTKNLISVSPENTVEECIHLILDSKHRYLPVVEDGVFKGVITIHDILREALRSKEALFDSSLTDRLIEEGGIY